MTVSSSSVLRRCWVAIGALWCAAGAAAHGEAKWRQIQWKRESAWESTASGWTAIVSVERSRLVWLGPVGGTNLLYVESKNTISWGGHRVWLGPQANWLEPWPPPADWEASASAKIQASGARLLVVQPHTDARYPQISRSYEWRQGVLHCGVSWQGTAYHAIQILQVPRWTLVRLQCKTQADLPRGYALAAIYGRPENANAEIAPSVSRMDGEHLTLWHGNVSEKIALVPQDIVADVGDFRLVMRRGSSTEVAGSAPDKGLLTQVFVGDWENPFIEIEQYSHYGNGKQSAFEVEIIPERLK